MFNSVGSKNAMSLYGDTEKNIGNSSVIAMHGVSLKLPSDAGMVEILRGIDFSVDAGETVGLVGPSGSGKTSLMMLLAGLERPTQGDVFVDGENITNLNEDALARFRQLRVGIIFQNFHLISTMTAQENVSLPLELARIKNPEKLAVNALESVGLSHRLRHFPWQLSGGEQQRVAVARAFVVKPRVLFADEPTGNLDHESGSTVTNLLFTMTKNHNSTLLMITHDLKLASRCDRTVHMQDGRIVVDHPLRHDAVA